MLPSTAKMVMIMIVILLYTYKCPIQVLPRNKNDISVAQAIAMVDSEYSLQVLRK